MQDLYYETTISVYSLISAQNDIFGHSDPYGMFFSFSGKETNASILNYHWGAVVMTEVRKCSSDVGIFLLPPLHQARLTLVLFLDFQVVLVYLASFSTDHVTELQMGP